MNNLDRLVKRLQKIGITLELFGNYPWVYIDTINGIKVKSKFHSEHRFTIAYGPKKGGEFDFTDLTRIFQEIRDVLNMAH